MALSGVKGLNTLLVRLRLNITTSTELSGFSFSNKVAVNLGKAGRDVWACQQKLLTAGILWHAVAGD